MKKSSLFVVLSTLAVSTLIWVACSKPKVTPAKDPAYIKKLSLSVPFQCQVPAVEGDMLVFADAEQYQCYYDFLTEVLNRKEDSTDGNDILDSIENSIGYTSLRHQKLTEYEAINSTTGWTSLSSVPQEDWITSVVRRSILSVNREVKIADNYEKWLSPEWMVYVDASHPELLSDLTALGSNPSLYDIMALDINRDYISISSLTDPERVFGSNKFADLMGKNGTPIHPVSGWQVSGTVHPKFKCTDAVNIAVFEGFRASYNSIPNKCRYRIYYNDGYSPGYYQDFISSIGIGETILQNVEKGYDAGTWHPTIEVYAISPQNSGNTPIATLTYNVDILGLGATCTSVNHSKDQYYYINSNNAIRGFVEFHSWTNWLTGKNSEFDGYTELHVLTNGHWNRRKAKDTHLCVNLIGDVRYNDPTYGDCTPVNGSPLTIYKCTTNSNQVYNEAQYSGWKKFRGVKSRHEVSINGGVNGSFEQEILACD